MTFSQNLCWKSYLMPCSSKCLVIFEARMYSRTLHRMQVREMGWYFLNMGVTFALHQSLGSFLVCKDLSKITVIIGASSTWGSFSSNGRSLSGPAALPGLRLFRTSKYHWWKSLYQAWSGFCRVCCGTFIRTHLSFVNKVLKSHLGQPSQTQSGLGSKNRLELLIVHIILFSDVTFSQEL